MDDRYGMPVPDTDKREIGDLATWSVATAKSSNGVEMLRDNNGTSKRITCLRLTRHVSRALRTLFVSCTLLAGCS